jgi:hypothetical protein
MTPQELYRRLLAAIPREGEVRRHVGDESLLITRHDTPTTIISALAKAGPAIGWLTLEADGRHLELHHPRNPELVMRLLDALAPGAA